MGFFLIVNTLSGYSQSQIGQSENVNCEILEKDLSEVEKRPIVHVNPFYTEGDELPQLTTVFDILVDQSGYTWFATSTGIRRYNGYDFLDFGIQNGLTDPIIIHLYEDYSGRIWSVSLSGLLHCFKNGVMHPYPHNDLVAPFLNQDLTTSFYCDSSETLHLGSYTEGYIQVTKEGEITEVVSPESAHKGIGLILIDDSIPFFFQTPCEDRDKVTFYNSNLDVLKEFNLCGEEGCEKHFGKTIRLLQLTDQSFLLSYENVLAKFSLNGDIERYYYSGNIIALCEDNNGSIWISIDGKQVLFYPQKLDHEVSPTSYFTGRKVTAIKEDKQHGVWIGTFHSSVYYIPITYASFYKIRDMFTYEDYPGDFITSRTFSKDNFQLLSRKGHLFFSQGTSMKCIELKHAIGVDNMSFSGLHTKSKDNFMLGGQKGIYTINGNVLNLISQSYSDKISRRTNTILTSKDSSIWLNAGPRLLNVKNGEIRFLSDTIGGEVHSFVESENGDIWIGGQNGLWKYSGGTLTHLGATDSLLRYPIITMAEFGGSLWINSRNHDLLRKGLNQKAEVFNYGGKTFPHTVAFYVKKDEFYFVSDYYLNKIELPSQTDSFQVEAIRLSKKFSVKSGGPLLGEWQGKLTYISSADVHQFHFLPEFKQKRELPFHIEQFKINNRDTTLQREYQLSHRENHISIGFVMISNSEARATKYKYRIKGIDPEWIETADRKVQYTSLPTGTHVFEVFAKPTEGTWTKKPVTLSFTIAPPYWETWWFIALCILASIVFIGATVRYRFRRIRKEDALQMALNESQQHALSARMNPHFIFNALNSIKTFVLENDTVQSNDYIARFSKLMRQILDQSQFTLVPLEDELMALDNYVSLELMRGKDRFSYSIYVDPNIDQKKATVPSLLLQPFVENAIWHGIMPLNRHGTITVSIEQTTNQILCKIQDDGVGRARPRSNSQKHQSASTQISNKRLELINKRFGTQIEITFEDLKDEQGQVLGTRVVIPLPLEFKH